MADLSQYDHMPRSVRPQCVTIILFLNRLRTVLPQMQLVDDDVDCQAYLISFEMMTDYM